MLEKYGLKANDAILAEEKHMGIYEDLLQNRDAKLIAGGAAQNTARGAQVYQPTHLNPHNPPPLPSSPLSPPRTNPPSPRPSQYILPPSSVLYIGCVGSDKYADILRSANATAGLRVEYLIDAATPTGRCGVVITGHNRSMVTHLAAANEYKFSHLQSPPIWPLVEAAEYFFVGGYHLTVCVPAVMALAKEAATKNKVFMLSLSAPFIPQFFKEPLDQTAPFWDYVVGNETEMRSYAESHGLGTQDVAEIAKMVAALPKENEKRKRVVVATQGTEPTIIAVQGEDKVKEFAVHAIIKDEICDTTGAGYVLFPNPLFY